MDEYCNMQCAGDSTKLCGGYSSYFVYNIRGEARAHAHAHAYVHVFTCPPARPPARPPAHLFSPSRVFAAAPPDGGYSDPWAAGQPMSGSDDSECLVMTCDETNSWTWKAENCNRQFEFICEYGTLPYIAQFVPEAPFFRGQPISEGIFGLVSNSGHLTSTRLLYG